MSAIRLYKSLLRPILEFGAQVVNFNAKQISELDKAQTSVLRRLLGLLPNVKPATVRLLAGVEPLESRFNQLKLSYFHKLRTCSKKRLLSKIFRARFSDFDKSFFCDKPYTPPHVSTKNGFISNCHSLFFKYKIAHEFNFISTQPKTRFKSYLRKTILEHHHSVDQSSLLSSSQASIFNLATIGVLKARPYRGTYLGSQLLNGIDRTARNVLLRALSGENFLAEYRCSLFKRNPGESCPFCNHTSRDIHHYFHNCNHFCNHRNLYYENLSKINVNITSYLNSIAERDLNKTVFLLISKPPELILKNCKDRETILKYTAAFLRE